MGRIRLQPSNNPNFSRLYEAIAHEVFVDWIEIPEKLADQHSPVVLLGANSWSAHNFLQRICRADQTLIWIEISGRDQSDPIVLGNRLSKAVERAFGTPLFGMGMPFTYGLSVLQRHQGLLGSFALGLCGADFAPELVDGLMALQDESSSLVLCYTQPPQLEGLKDAFVIDLRSSLKVEPLAISEEEQDLEQQGIFSVLVAQRRWVEAFEWSVLHFPAKSEHVLEKAANLMWAHGESDRLYRLLSQLPQRMCNRGLIMRWQFTALLDLGREGEMLEEVRAKLQTQEAPELRSLYAIALFRLNESAEALREARAAYDSLPCAITNYALGFILPVEDPEAAIPFLKEAIHHAEVEDRIYESAQTALTLTHTYFQIGKYQEASDWALWGIKYCEERGLTNQQMRLELFNEFAYMRILMGDTAGLESQLEENISHLEAIVVRPFTEAILKSTLADLLLVERRVFESLKIYRNTWDKITRRQHYNFLADSYVRVLLEANDFDGALAISEMAVKLTDGLPVVFTRRSRLAFAMAQSIVDPEKGVASLKALLNELDNKKYKFVQLSTRAKLYLSRALLTLGKQTEADIHLSDLSEILSNSGAESLDFMAGPAHLFQEVFSKLRGTHYPLEINFLGQQEVRLYGVQIPLRRRFLEILTVLALHPEGMTSDELTLAVYGDRGTTETLRSDLSRLREAIPITPKPYRLRLPVKADFVDLHRLITRGKIREALRLYQGPLLPDSTAEGVEIEREYLDNALRNAVLSSQDPEALMGLAEKLKGDLEVWEEAVRCLSQNDPRRIIAQARVQNVSTQWN